MQAGKKSERHSKIIRANIIDKSAANPVDARQKSAAIRFCPSSSAVEK